MTRIAEVDIKEYLECPYCNSLEYDMKESMIKGSNAHLAAISKVWCNDCEKEWALVVDNKDNKFLVGSFITTDNQDTYDYKKYITTLTWRLKAGEAKERAGYRCQLCNSAGKLHTHHRTYKRLGKELPGDLTVLCTDCHAKFHDITSRA